jgi:hypothetical protein
MQKSKINTGLRWLVLLLIGTSISFSTLHSHHEVEWNHAEKHTDSEHCITQSTNVCPICGYLSNAEIADQQPTSLSLSAQGPVGTLSESQQLDSFSGTITGRSPPSFI